MDRDDKWESIEKTYKLLTESAGEKFERASLHIEKNYKKGITDEFIGPGFNKNSERIQDGDAVIFFNYREDSARELTSSFAQIEFNEFPRKKIADLKFVTMTEYDPAIPTLVAFPPLKIENSLSKVVSLAGLKQLHIAESEKYAHVTYFFNGGKEDPFENEDRILIPSPKTAHYDEIPEMSSYQITERAIQELNHYDFIVINFANTDMVGHTGNLEACIKALEVADDCIGKIIPKILEKEGTALITSDHGNIEEKIYKLTGKKMTKHTTNPVPFYLVGKKWKRKTPLEPNKITQCYKETKGVLTDIAPTVLELLEIKIPAEITGKSLIPKLK